MFKKPKLWATFVSYLIVVLYLLLTVGACFADSPDRQLVKHNIDIEGTKIISEGGYLWFRVVNHDVPLSIYINFPSDVKVIGKATNRIDLETNQSADFYFQVPYYWSQPSGSIPPFPTKKLKFDFNIYNSTPDDGYGYENVEFEVHVVPLSSTGDNQGLLYLTVLAAATVAITTVVLAARLSRERKARSMPDVNL